MGDSLWGNSLPGDDDVLSESIICDSKEQNKERIRGKRFRWTPQLVDVLRTLLRDYRDVAAFSRFDLDRLEILGRAVESHNEQQVSLLF